MAKKVLLAAPRRYCAGVDRAVEVVRRALAHFGSPIYVREQIVHNVHVVSELERECAVFVESERDVPYGETLIFSAHGVSPAVRAGAEGRELRVIDAACPLVTKVHSEAIRLARAGYRIALIGHAEQEEVEGALGEAPEATIPENCGTRARRPLLRHVQPPACGQGPQRTSLVLVVGSANSSNSQRLVETARTSGADSFLIEDETAIDPAWLEGVDTVGVTAGASAPERLVQRVCAWLCESNAAEVEELVTSRETVTFAQPHELRHAKPLGDVKPAATSA